MKESTPEVDGMLIMFDKIAFEKVDIKVIDVEINHALTIFPGSFKEIDDYLQSQGYVLHSIIARQDAIYVKKGFIDEINEL